MGIERIEELRVHVDEEINERKKDLQNGKLDMSLGELSSMYVEEDLIINPEFQRLFRWDKYQKTRLIESILVGIPIPSIFVVENEEGQWELIDGLQRLSTVFSFMGKLKDKDKNNWKLGEGDILKKINKLTFDDLPPRARNLIKRYVCRVEIIYYGSDYNTRYELFERLNTGGSPLSDQEIRNAIYRADSPDFNEFLTRNGTKNKQFIDLVNVSDNKINNLYVDELVLRFCSLYEKQKITKNLSNHLDSYMKDIVKRTKNDSMKIYDLEHIFKRTINLLINLNKNNIFWRENGFSATLYDGIMIGLARNINLYEKQDSQKLLISKIEELKNNTEFNIEFSGSQSHNAKNIMGRLNIADKIFSDV